ncbi:MAG: glycosyltransferase [Elusimicrobia bacterium]|nr:glycosyltransferase [Elusimicrobiota bacterium]
MRTTLLMPTVNELEGLKLMMPRIKKQWFDEMLVIDGRSTDGTVEYARAQGCRVVAQQSRGITNAYREALEHATGDVVVAFSPDGNSLPERIPDLLAKMEEGYDMVIVSRYAQGAKSEDDDAVTGLGNWIFTQMINVLFGAHYTDSLVMFRAFRKDLAQGLPTDLPRAGLEPYLAIQCAKRGLKVCDIPGDEPKRVGSARKMHPILNGIDILRLISRERFGLL